VRERLEASQQAAGARAAMIEAIRRELVARADPAKAPEMQRYMKSSMPFLGVQKPGRVEVARAVFAAHRLDGFDAWRDTVLALWREATYREERYLAIALARDRRYREHRTVAALPLYEELIVTGAWWDFVDEVAIRLVGELDVAPVLREWATGEDLWKRRTAIIAQIARKDRTDEGLLFDCIEPNRGDREFFVRKAIGWALREYAKVDPEAVERYCATHELSPLSHREALKNFTP
jgi:3-methyladenine DNA glycosylase AlkD